MSQNQGPTIIPPDMVAQSLKGMILILDPTCFRHRNTLPFFFVQLEDQPTVNSSGSQNLLATKLKMPPPIYPNDCLAILNLQKCFTT